MNEIIKDLAARVERLEAEVKRMQAERERMGLYFRQDWTNGDEETEEAEEE